MPQQVAASPMPTTSTTCWSCDKPVEQNAQFCPFCGIENPTHVPLDTGKVGSADEPPDTLNPSYESETGDSSTRDEHRIADEPAGVTPPPHANETGTVGPPHPEHRPQLSRPEIESLVFVLVVTAALGALLFGWIGATLLAFIAGTLLRWSQRKGNTPLIPEPLRQAVWLPISALDAIATLLERSEKLKSGRRPSASVRLKPETSQASAGQPTVKNVDRVESATGMKTSSRLTMNRKTIALIGAAVFCFLLVFPPWNYTDYKTAYQRGDHSYEYVATKMRLRPVWSEKSATWRPPRIGSFYPGIKPVYHAEINTTIWMVLLALTAVGTGGAYIVIGQRKETSSPRPIQ